MAWSPPSARRGALEDTSGGASALWGPEHWRLPLSQLAQATGLTASAFDAELVRRSGPHLASPLAQLLATRDPWAEGGGLDAAERDLARAAARSFAILPGRFADALSIVAIPVRLDGVVAGVLVVGWVFDHFPDPIECTRVAQRLGLLDMTFWDAARRQPPVSPHRLATVGEMVRGFAESLIGQIELRRREKLATDRLGRLEQASEALVRARSVSEISEVLLAAALDMSTASHARVVLRQQGASELIRLSACAPEAPHPAAYTVRVDLRADSGLVGAIELQGSEGSAAPPELVALGAEAAIAVERAALVDRLERDQDRLKEALAEAARANAIKDQFLAMVSHDLRTPLSSIVLRLQLMRRRSHDPEQLRAGLDIIERNVQTQRRLIDDLMDSMRLSSGKLRLDLEDAELAPILEGALEGVRPLAEAKGVALVHAPPGVPAPLRADPVRLDQVFVNLLSNAVKFTPPGGRVELAASVEPASVTVEVRDTGRGIPADFLPSLFQRFAQVGAGEDRANQGLGLGLWITRQLVRAHGGEIEAESAGEGRGAVFRVSLPLRG